MSNIFSDPLADLMIAMIKDKALQLKEKKKLCDKIQQFIEQKEKYNNICSLAEEIDFQGFVEFISETHIDELRSCILGTQEERQSARKSIINGAISYSQAKTPQARYRVQKLASSIIEIVKSFYKKKANKELLLVAAEIVDEIDEKIQESNIEQTQIIVNEIQRGKQEIIDIISSTKDCRILPISSLRDLSEDNLSQIEDSFDTYLETLSKRHKLYPFYKYTLDSNLGNGLKLKSIPLSKEAFDKYPPNIKFKGTARFGDGDVVTSRPNLDIFDYANRHQLQIKINVQDAKKYLGDFEDPVQDEAKLLEGNEIVILPKPFPKAFPCSISLDKVVVFDYVLLRTKEIMDDGIVVITNEEQENTPFRFCWRINFSKHSTDFNMHLEKKDSSHRLQFARFKKIAMNSQVLSVKSLELGEVFLEGNLNPASYDDGFNSIDEEILFWKRIVAVEDYFGEKILIPREIHESEDYNLRYLSALINGESFQGKWTSVEGQFQVTQELKNEVFQINNRSFSFLCHNNVVVSLFGVDYHLEVERIYHPIHIRNYDKLGEKLKVLEDGDSVRIEFVPAEKNGVGIYTDKIFCEESE